MLKEFKLLLPYLRKRAPFYAAGLLFLLVTDFFQLYIPELMRQAINLITTLSFEMQQVLFFSLALVGCAAMVAAGRFFWRFFIIGSARKIETELRQDIFSHLMQLPAHFYQDYQTGDLMARATNDMNSVRMAISMGFVALFDGLVMTLAILIFLFSRYGLLALYCVMPIPIITLLILLFGRELGRRFRSVHEGFSQVSQFLQESYSGIQVIKNFRKEDFFSRRFAKTNDQYIEKNLKLIRLWGVLHPATIFVAGLSSLALLFFGGQQVLEGSLKPGDFVAILSYLQMLVWPMMGAGFVVNLIQRGGAALKRINEILEAETRKNTPACLSKNESLRQPALKIDQLDYCYPGNSEKVLDDISLEISYARNIGLTGRTGSGKTTLIQLICRFLDCGPGKIRVNGKDISLVELAEYRALFGVVPQDSFLFSQSLRENLLFGRRDPGDEKLKELLEMASFSRDLGLMPDGLETRVGEKGISLSGGQKQRLALARALFDDPDILLMDDPFSSVDMETEKESLRKILSFRSGKSNLLISHRVSAMQNMDYIYVLDKGKIIQQGRHEQLIQQQGLYQLIYHIQQKEGGRFEG